MQKLIILACGIFLSTAAFSQNSPAIKEYIAKYKDIAIEEMIRTGVPAAIKLAQGIHETEAGRSKLCVKSNNHFGIKCKSEWKGEWVSHDDDAKGECFRKYGDPADSYRDHSDFLKTRAHYAALFKLDPTDYEGWAYGLKKAGYATNPKYPQLIIKLIKDYNLQEYTLIALGRKTEEEEVIAASPIAEVVMGGIKEEYTSAVPARIPVNYPEGKFMINETPVVYVSAGTSYLSIAEKHNISLSRLFEFNDRKEEEAVEYDQLVYLQRKRRTGAQEFHTVAEGETLHDIAQAEGIRLESLLELNQLRAGMQPAVGEKLNLKSKSSAMPVLRMAAAKQQEARPAMVQQTEIVHTVQPQETVYAISKKYGVSIDDILKWNNLQGTDLRKGQELKIIR